MYFQRANELIGGSERLPEGFPPDDQHEDYFALRFSYAEMLRERVFGGSGTQEDGSRVADVTLVTGDVETQFYYDGFVSGYVTDDARHESFPTELFKQTGWQDHHRSTCDAAWRDGVRIGLAIQQERAAWEATRQIMFG
ncbi:MAG: hypothetical protein HKM24_03900 [Gammaproteobacteria bacterium]|nr:hypothetical protein [Gammaproteobacteria bacterium]